MERLINGKAIAEKFCETLKKKVEKLKDHGITPCIALIKANNDPASEIYVSKKENLAKVLGIRSQTYKFLPGVKEDFLKNLINDLNQDPTVHAILLQSPLAEGLSFKKLINFISPEKDVDGLTSVNQGKLFAGEDCVLPCTPQGVMHLIHSVKKNISGMHAVVLGRSVIVGRPMISLLLNNDCTVTALHSKSKNVLGICSNADIIVSAIGKPKFITKDFIKPGAIVIDVGINRIITPEGKKKVVGDVDLDDVWNSVEAITPVPNGVGPMTVAYLMSNTVNLAINQNRKKIGLTLDKF
ncbi:MAG: bifunctional 5,10-methylenetetrahydrofolate dehydrogenase/5,10-methenyltetrahydrofolate cyclohydrolase [Alphaproteobacteria bacterium]|nr:bifunctional 5,10-methylenetetrahydrofolate dehydrogenase/5,10-methenyltetrahydrofolate cyclohydrolase [Alphaproteobacteria bacterium]